MESNPVTDIDLLQTELEALRRQNAILRETLDTLQGSVVVYDADRRYLLANRAYHTIYPHLPPDEELVGRKYEEVLGLSIAAGTVDNPEAYTSRDVFISRRIDDMERRKSVPLDMQNSRPGRESLDPRTGRWYLVRSRRTPSGNDVSLRVDITAQKQLQHELERAREAAETANSMKSQFLGNVSHELRTPLNAVINFARLIADQIHGPVAPEYREYAQDIAEGGTNLLELIDELLDLARAEAGRLTIAEGVVHPGRLIAATCRVLAPEAANVGVSLDHDIAPGLGALRGDTARLRQVLLNLVANAIKFTGAGGTVSVIASKVSDGSLHVAVRDTGVGIAKHDLQRIMEPFEQVPRVTGRQRPGVGLGLPLSRHLVELHGGQLRLESQVGHGTTAVVTLPASRRLTRQSEAVEVAA